MRSFVCWTAVLLVVAPIGLGACGGNDAASARDAPSRKEWARKANRICSEADRHSHWRKVKTIPSIVRQLEDLKTVYERAVGRLMLLPKPSGKAGRRAQRFLDALDHEYARQALPALRRFEEAVSGHDLAGLEAVLRRLRTLSRGKSKSQRLAVRLGARECAED